MSLSCKDFRRICVLGTIFVVLEPGALFAGWMGFRNDTKASIVIQETLIINGRAIVGKPQKLSSGETVRDIQFNVLGFRQITIYDAKNPKTPIYMGNFPCPGLRENVLYSLRMDKTGKIVVEAIRTPVQR